MTGCMPFQYDNMYLEIMSSCLFIRNRWTWTWYESSFMWIWFKCWGIELSNKYCFHFLTGVDQFVVRVNVCNSRQFYTPLPKYIFIHMSRKFDACSIRGHYVEKHCRFHHFYLKMHYYQKLIWWIALVHHKFFPTKLIYTNVFASVITKMDVSAALCVLCVCVCDPEPYNMEQSTTRKRNNFKIGKVLVWEYNCIPDDQSRTATTERSHLVRNRIGYSKKSVFIIIIYSPTRKF